MTWLAYRRHKYPNTKVPFNTKKDWDRSTAPKAQHWATNAWVHLKYTEDALTGLGPLTATRGGKRECWKGDGRDREGRLINPRKVDCGYRIKKKK